MKTRKLDDQYLEGTVRGWLRNEDESPADRNRQIGRIMGRVDETKQRRRLWPLNPFGQRAVHSATGTEEVISGSSLGRRQRTGLTPVHALASVALVAILVVSVLYVASQRPSVTEQPGAPSAAASLDELIELSQRAWGGEGELLAEVYAPEGVHTATFFDRTNTYEGPAEIAWVAGFGGVEPIGPRVDIPAAEGEYRWASFSTLGGGTACLFHAVEGRIVRHDCLVPERSNEARAAGALADGSTSAAIDELVARMELGWDSGSLEDLEAVYAPDAVHTARYLDTTRQYVGPAEIAWVAGYGAPQPIGPRVELAAPEGELAWAQVSGAVGGTVCLFHAVEGLVTRHDCVLPVAS